MTTRTRRTGALLLAPLAAVLALGACSTGSDSAAFCATASEAQAEFASSTATSALTGGDTEALKEYYTQINDVYATMSDQAPDEIADDVATLADMSSQMQALLVDADYDMTAVDTTALSQIVSSGDYTAASENVQQYLSDTCKIDVSVSAD